MTVTPPNSQSSAVRMVEIDADLEGQRLDNYLITQLKGVPRSRVYRLLRTGEVRINGGRVKPHYRLQAGDVLRIPPVRQSSTGSQDENIARIDPGHNKDLLKRVKDSLIFEDAHFLVINKPSGLAVHGGSGLSYGLIEALRQIFPRSRRMELVHRLDRETSGCLLVAKKTSVLRDLHEQIRAFEMEKQYVTLVKGVMSEKEARVTARLRKNTSRSGERIVIVADDGKEAESLFRRRRVFGELASMVEVDLTTGRTHQIRVHAAHIGHPVAGDEKYGNREFNKTLKA